MDNLRSKVIRLAYANPDLRGPLLGVLKAGGGPRAGYEIHVSASYRDYHKDPQAPVQTHNLGPRSLAFIRLDITEAKLTKSMVDDIVRSTMRDWSSKLGTGGVFTITYPGMPSGGGAERPRAIVPDHYREATIKVEKALASGYHNPLATWRWTRESGDWVKG